MKMTSHDIIRKPVITEKSMAAMADRKYTFIVDIHANKFQIKKAGKTERVGVHVGERANFKKAIVTLTTDSKTIEFFEGM